MWDMAGRCGVLGARGGEERIGGWGAERAGGTVWQDCQL